MHYRSLGRSGLKVSVLGLGTDNIVNPTPEDESIAMILAALDAGINLIDTSNSYAQGESERIIGRALRESGRRDEAVIATKAHYPTGPGPNDRGNARVHLVRACEDSLRRLGTDHIDLYQLHRPDFDVPVEETLRALDDLVRSGKVRYIGSSTSPAWRIVESVVLAELRGWTRFISEQPPYNLLDRRVENETVPAALAHGVGLLPWSPLAMGVLGGRYADPSPTEAPDPDSRFARRGGIYAERISDDAIRAGNRFVRLARESGHDAAQAAIAWVRDQPGVVAPLIGPRNSEQLRHLGAAADVVLSNELCRACDDVCAPGSAVANFHNSAPWMKMQLQPASL